MAAEVMRSVRVVSHDGPADLRIEESAVPVPGDCEVLIAVEAAAVNFPDLLLTQGRYQYRPDLPFVLGGELAGRVVSAPSGSAFRPGDRVAATSTLGAFAEYVAVDAARVYPVPDRVGFAEAACLPMNYLTMSFGLQTRGELWPGETVLVHGAAGGIGSATVQLCRAIGARVIAVVSSPQKAEFVRSLGASEVVAVEGFKDTVLGLTDRAGVDVVVDPVGGDRFTDSLRCLAPLGRLLVVGFTAGEIPTVKVNRLLLNNIDVRGVGWGAYADRNPDAYREEWRKLLPLLENGAIGPPISEIVPLDGVRSAVERLSDRAVLGKVVLAIGSETSARR
ncbi:NADPH:quinone oxidoreductase family protein [Pseudonocardia thermophila]|uniref:NADPH:quinone oxidoreductase family protein n=1 Tax=Pseudonocardia thermophila TaxID=1848 RepID=UPI0031E4F535